MLEVYGMTDKGMVRSQNQDAIYISNDENIKMYIVADGMGGANAGDIASTKCIEYIKEYIFENYTEKSMNEITNLLKNAIDYSNKKVYELSIQNPEYEGMGTTVIVLLIVKNKLYIAHVGDSSFFRIRKNIIRKITKDHTYVQTLIDDKTITKQEAKVHPKRHMITKVLGCEVILEPDILMKKVEDYDYIVICTDGLTNMVNDKEIMNIVKDNDNSKISCEKLINLANERGGHDNISVIILKYINGGE